MTYTAENSERALIGSLMLDPELIEIVKDKGVNQAWLKDERHKEIFEILIESSDEGKILDANTIMDKGFDYDYITGLIDSANPSFFEENLHNIGIARLNDAIKKRIARDPENPQAVRSLIDSFDDKFSETKILKVSQIAKEKAKEMLEETPAIEMNLPWNDMNITLGGIKRQKLYFIGGLPGHRKTDFAINIADHILEQGFRVLYCDYEIGEGDTFERFFTKRKKIPNTCISTRRDEFGTILTAIERQGMSESMEAYSDELEDRLNIVCYPKINEVKSIAKAVKADVIFIDHIQLFSEEHPLRKDDTKPSHINSLCRRLKKLSRELDAAIICPSQIGKNCDGPPKKRDFKESAGMSENGDVLIGVWWPHAEQKILNSKGKACNQNHFESELAKHRGGPVGRYELHVDVTTGLMSEFSKREEPPRYEKDINEYEL